MARKPKPWFWEARNQWCVTIKGKRHMLGEDKKLAEVRFHQLMANGGEKPSLPDGSVAALLDDFLTWTEENRSRKTYEGYRAFCQSFVSTFPKLTIAELTPAHVTAWLNGRNTWNSTTKHGAVVAIQRAMNWGLTNGGLPVNPLAGIEKPEAKTRTQVISLKEFKALLRACRDRLFREMLRFCWETGCRPQEAKQLEPRHVELQKNRCILPASEAKKNRLRVIYLTPKAKVIVKRLLGKHSEGRLFRNCRGRPWTASAVKCRFSRLETKLGRRYFQYMFRHAWITRKLKAGVDSHIVGSLAGHADTKMIDKVYSHVAEDHEFMLAQAMKE